MVDCALRIFSVEDHVTCGFALLLVRYHNYAGKIPWERVCMYQWERQFAPNFNFDRPYFVDHESRTTTRTSPRTIPEG